MTTSLELAQSLEFARLASGLTFQELTAKAGVSRQAVYRLFRGNDVQVSTLMAVMEVLQLDLAAVPRGLKRGLPELSPAGQVLNQYKRLDLSASPSVVEPSRAPSHVLSAVQQRLARLQKDGGTSTIPKSRK